ncbi:IS200/IS605 family element transposase accessory protein TnpB [Clostridium botulinum C]|uniref:Transposase n=1 Tax=Clostridium novyi TaxID=1542 RepID=A0ABF7PGH7_CLONO|nr:MULTISPECIES: RNA-guided endonuclease TnpB family protein [Clostridium]AYF54542.1 transposase [Clostridium novyi]MCD3216316.1 IS200/IS605 family element transposase accessory protein TnpB [Clostridium botulinum C]8HR5_A Chain A, Transposase [Clostridium novyi]8HR5_B Chain B, Transposase [Clostridium novyi]
MITVRKIKLTIMGDKDTRNSQYKWIRDEQYNQYRALNMGMTYLAVNDILYMNESGLEIRTIKDLKDCEKDIDKNKKEIEKLTARLEKEQNKKNSSSEKLDEIKYKISLVENKIEDYKLKIVELNKILEETQKERMDIQKEFKEKYVDDLYQVLDKIPFKHLDNKSLVTQRIKADIKSDKSNGLLKGERSIRNYKRNFPLMTRGRDLKFKYDDNDDIEIKWMEGIKFKVILGNRIKNSLELRHTLHKVIEGKYKICDSSLQFDKNNNLILNLTLDIPIDIVNKKVSGRVVGVDLGLKIPAYCALNDVEYIKKSIGRIDDFLKVRTQMQSRRRRLQIAIQSAKGGKGRVNKLQALERFAEKEKNFAKTYNHFLSSNIVKFAVSNQAEQINMELLSLKETQNKSILRNWSYYQLQTMIEYKAQREGIKVKYIDPYHTSQTCSKCGNYEEGQRESQADFICKKCGYKVNADYNAARNIAMSNKYITKKEESKYYKIKESMV